MPTGRERGRDRSGHRRAPSHLAVRRRLRHFEFGQCCHSRSRGARPYQCHIGDGGSAEFLPLRGDSLDVLNSVAPRVAIGLHLALTAPFRPLSKGFGPLSEGAFLPLAATVRHAAMRRFDHDTLVAEITRQMQSFLDHLRSRARLRRWAPARASAAANQRRAARGREGDRCRTPGCDNAAASLPLSARFADRKGLLLDIMSYRFRRRAAALGLRTNPAFRRHL